MSELTKSLLLVWGSGLVWGLTIYYTAEPRSWRFAASFAIAAPLFATVILLLGAATS